MGEVEVDKREVWPILGRDWGEIGQVRERRLENYIIVKG